MTTIACLVSIRAPVERVRIADAQDEEVGVGVGVVAILAADLVDLVVVCDGEHPLVACGGGGGRAPRHTAHDLEELVRTRSEAVDFARVRRRIEQRRLGYRFAHEAARVGLIEYAVVVVVVVVVVDVTASSSAEARMDAEWRAVARTLGHEVLEASPAQPLDLVEDELAIDALLNTRILLELHYYSINNNNCPKWLAAHTHTLGLS